MDTMAAMRSSNPPTEPQMRALTAGLAACNRCRDHQWAMRLKTGLKSSCCCFDKLREEGRSCELGSSRQWLEARQTCLSVSRGPGSAYSAPVARIVNIREQETSTGNFSDKLRPLLSLIISRATHFKRNRRKLYLVAVWTQTRKSQGMWFWLALGWLAILTGARDVTLDTDESARRPTTPIPTNLTNASKLTGDTSETQPRDDQDDIGESRILTPELFNDTGPNDDGIAQVEEGSNEEVDTGLNNSNHNNDEKMWGVELDNNTIISVAALGVSVVCFGCLLCCLPRSLSRIRMRALRDYEVLRNVVIENRENHFNRELMRIGRDIEYLRSISTNTLWSKNWNEAHMNSSVQGSLAGDCSSNRKFVPNEAWRDTITTQGAAKIFEPPVPSRKREQNNSSVWYEADTDTVTIVNGPDGLENQNCFEMQEIHRSEEPGAVGGMQDVDIDEGKGEPEKGRRLPRLPYLYRRDSEGN